MTDERTTAADIGMNEMSVDERRRRILEILAAKGKVRVAELSRQFCISDVTIRLDLGELEKAGLLERVHGGAVSTNKAYFNMDFSERIGRFEKEKRDIARAAADMVQDNDTLIINSGTTTYFIAQELKKRKALTVVTNSIMIAQELAHIQNFNVILLGGNYNYQYQFTYGDDAVNQLQRYKTDKLILSVDGISSMAGLTTHHHQEAEVNRLMLQRVNQVIVVADYSKIGRENFAFIAPLNSADILITNRTADQEELAALADHSIEICTV